jgi:hypothetical protein
MLVAPLQLLLPQGLCSCATRFVPFGAVHHLPTIALTNATGDLIYAGLRDGFRGRTFGGPPPAPPGASSDDLAAGAGALLRGMADAGYALRAEVSATGPGGFTVSLTGPCNLWALRALGSRGAAVVNAYDVLALDSWLRASGRSAAVELELTESGVNETWTLMA